MFSNLVESKGSKVRRRGSMVFSFIAHYGLILGVIYTSARAETVPDAPRPENIRFVTPPEPPKQQPQPPAPEISVAPPAPRTSPVLVAPISIPNTLPDIDLTQRLTDPEEFALRSTTKCGTDEPVMTTTAEPGKEYFDFEVESPVMQAPNSAAPVYPDLLRQAGVEGEALVSFVVDTTGRVDLASVKVVRSTHDQFAAAVKSALPRMRFIPAEIGRRKVRQLVQQPFTFAIVK